MGFLAGKDVTDRFTGEITIPDVLFHDRGAEQDLMLMDKTEFKPSGADCFYRQELKDQ